MLLKTKFMKTIKFWYVTVTFKDRSPLITQWITKYNAITWMDTMQKKYPTATFTIEEFQKISKNN